MPNFEQDNVFYQAQAQLDKNKGEGTFPKGSQAPLSRLFRRTVSGGAAALQSLQEITKSWQIEDKEGPPGSGILELWSPQGPGTCDHNRHERIVNLVTCLPFFAVGVHTMRKRTTIEGKAYGASLLGVGVGAMAFHGSHGELRPWGRKLDYWCIALSTAALFRAMKPGSHWGTTAASLAFTPVHPLAVTAVNTGIMELEFKSQASRGPAKLAKAHRLHQVTAGIGAACFCLEEAYPKLPFLHSAWHCLSAVGIATTNGLLAEIEEQKRNVQ